MGKNKLTKAEARELITPVVDDEVSAEERETFLDFIEHHDDVRREYESVKKIKSLVCTRCPCAKAPDSLKNYVTMLVQQEDASENADAPIYDIPGGGPASQSDEPSLPQAQSSISRRWLFSIAASLLLIVAVWGFFNFYETSETTPIYNVEDYAYEHFTKHDGQFVPPTISTASLGSAEMRMARDYNMPMTVPAVEDAEFKGIVYGEFVPNFKAPMLEYYLPSGDQYIYIFAFKLDKLKAFGQLARHQEAIKKCNKPKDFYIRDVKGKHVVSWKWDDVWYVAISNHNGNRLASLVKPMQDSSE